MENDEKVDIKFGEEKVKKTKYCKKCGAEINFVLNVELIKKN